MLSGPVLWGPTGSHSDPFNGDEESLGLITWPHLGKTYWQSLQGIPLWGQALMGLPGVTVLPPAGPGTTAGSGTGQTTLEAATAVSPDAGSSGVGVDW